MMNKRVILPAILLAAVSLWLGCEDDGITAPPMSQLVVTANPGAIVLDPDAGIDTGQATIAATVFDANGFPRRDVLVTFTTSGGVLASAAGGSSPAQVLTNSQGVALDTLTLAVTDPDSVEVTASSATISQSVTVTKSVVEGSIFVNANPTTVILDPDAGINSRTSTITAQIRDSQGAPIAGGLVSFSTSGGTLASQNLGGVITNSNGIATDTLTVTVGDPLTITVSATFSGLSAEVEISTTIIAGNQFPTADVIASPATRVQAGFPVTFDGRNSSDPDGVITCYQWEISSSLTPGMPEIVQGPSTSLITRTYDDPQTLSVTLRVSDDPTIAAQCQPASPPLSAAIFSPNLDFLSYQIVCDPTDPIAEAGPNQTVNLGVGPVAVQMDGGASSDPDTSIVEYRWTCNDGSGVKFGEQVTCNYSATGNYTVTLRVENECGQFDTDTVLVIVNP